MDIYYRLVQLKAIPDDLRSVKPYFYKKSTLRQLFRVPMTLEINLTSCSFYNADFDGDEMQLWRPIEI
jgi:hypothetical protein